MVTWDLKINYPEGSESACEDLEVLKVPAKQIPCFVLICNRGTR